MVAPIDYMSNRTSMQCVMLTLPNYPCDIFDIGRLERQHRRVVLRFSTSRARVNALC